MLVQKVGNSEMGFKSRDRIQQAVSLADMDDSQLANLACSITNTREQRRKNKRNSILLMLSLPVADTISKGLLETKGALNAAKPLANLPARAATMGKVAAGWGLIVAGISTYNLTKRALVPDSRRYERKHPIQSLVIDLGVILGASTLLIANRGKIQQTIVKNFPKTIEKFNEIVEKTLTSLEKTDFNKNILPELTEKVSKSQFAGAGKFVLRNALWITLGAGIIKMYHDTIKQNNKAERVYYRLKQEQNAAAQYLVASITQERMLLAQKDMLLAAALQEVMEKTTPSGTQ